jgi:CheY-like chemotaxis protein
VDDEPLVCESMRMLLELDGHSTDEAYDGSAALGKAAIERFDIVFTDFLMPGMKGDQLARELRRHEPCPPVVMVSGFPPHPPPPEITRIILKPISLNSVRDILSELVS